MDRSQLAGVGFVVLGLFQMTPFAVVVGGQRVDGFLLALAAAGVAITAMGGLMVYRGSEVTATTSVAPWVVLGCSVVSVLVGSAVALPA